MLNSNCASSKLGTFTPQSRCPIGLKQIVLGGERVAVDPAGSNDDASSSELDMPHTESFDVPRMDNTGNEMVSKELSHLFRVSSRADT